MTVFLRGVISADRLPLVSDFFLAGAVEDIPVQAILDTGFTGMVVLPRSLQSLGDFVLSGIERYELADGAVVSEELFTVTIRLGQQAMPVVASLTDSKLGLIGMALIDGKRAIFDLKRHIFKVLD